MIPRAHASNRRRTIAVLVLWAATALGCAAPDYAFDATLRSDAHCDRCDSGVCLDFRSDPANCGGCGVVCNGAQNAIPVCTDRTCGLACQDGYGDCDRGSPDCETDLTGSVAHCGACGARCPAPPAGHGTLAACSGSHCTEICATGRGDCNADLADGCEVDFATSFTHCGSCNSPCMAPTNGTAVCSAGRCVVMCNADFADCDGLAQTCEANLTSDPMNCGSCGNRCASGQVCTARICHF